MKVRLLISRAGAGFVQKVGDEVDVPTAEGETLVSAGKAAPVREQRVERAVRKQASEKASK